MLMRTTARKISAVLMMALVAMLLVTVGGSALSPQQRTTASPGDAVAASQLGRHLQVASPSFYDHGPLHLDLSSTPPVSASTPDQTVNVPRSQTVISYVDGAVIAPIGRAPPAL